MYIQKSEEPVGQWGRASLGAELDTADCPRRYKRGEKEKSRTSRGQLTPDVKELGGGRLLIADFGVSWRSVKASTKKEKLLKDWLSTFEADPTYRLRILGYSDCVGKEKNNRLLRRGRAQRVYRLLGKSARSRVISKGPAPMGTYVTGNSTAQSRAMNRGVIIQFQRDLEFSAQEGEVITGSPLKLVVKRALNLLKQPSARLGLSPHQTRRLGCILIRTLWRNVDDRFITAQSVLSFRNLTYKRKPDFSTVKRWVVRHAGPQKSDKEFLKRLAEIDAMIIDGRHKINQLYDQGSSTVSRRVRYLKGWVAKQQKNWHSIYHCYR